MATYDLTQTIPSYKQIAPGDVLFYHADGTEKGITLPKGTYKLECWGGCANSYGSTDSETSVKSQTTYTGAYVLTYFNNTDKKKNLFLNAGGGEYMICDGSSYYLCYNGNAVYDSTYYTDKRQLAGGASHISFVSGELKNLESHKDSILLVASGASGRTSAAIITRNGPPGGALVGDDGSSRSTANISNDATGATQLQGGSKTNPIDSSYYVNVVRMNTDGSFGLGGVGYVNSLKSAGSASYGGDAGAGFYGGGGGANFGDNSWGLLDMSVSTPSGASSFINNDLTYNGSMTAGTANSTVITSTASLSNLPGGHAYGTVKVTCLSVDNNVYVSFKQNNTWKEGLLRIKNNNNWSNINKLLFKTEGMWMNLLDKFIAVQPSQAEFESNRTNYYYHPLSNFNGSSWVFNNDLYGYDLKYTDVQLYGFTNNNIDYINGIIYESGTSRQTLKYFMWTYLEGEDIKINTVYSTYLGETGWKDQSYRNIEFIRDINISPLLLEFMEENAVYVSGGTTSIAYKQCCEYSTYNPNIQYYIKV